MVNSILKLMEYTGLIVLTVAILIVYTASLTHLLEDQKKKGLRKRGK